ncbi:MAG TPA: hypothetical protein VIG44_10875 [Thermomicrobiales bacterium]|jgi:hypothetical protein
MEMGARRVRWATNLPDGTPILIDGVIADVDDETGAMSLNDRTRDVIAEVLENDPRLSRAEQIPVIDLTEEIHRLLQAKHAAGIPVRSPLPKKHAIGTTHGASIQRSTDK